MFLSSHLHRNVSHSFYGYVYVDYVGFQPIFCIWTLFVSSVFTFVDIVITNNVVVFASNITRGVPLE